MPNEPRTASRRGFLGGVGLGVATVASLPGCLGSGPNPPEQLEEHESDHAPLRDPATAGSEGYRSIAGYRRSGDGVQGLSVLNGSVSELDPATPHVVLYDLTEEGTYEPLGVKWIRPASGTEERPTLFDTEFDGPFESQSPLLPRHYALTAWVFRDNPDGMFATSHPEVAPPPFLDELDPVWDRLGDLLTGQEAQDAGYENTEKCISAENGAYGVPFVNGNGGTTAPVDPPVLLYRATPNWNYRLLGAEWYVPVAEADGRPSAFGQRFHDPMDGHSPETSQPRHYGLHAWLVRLNPQGLFAPFNPLVQC
jgi:hypothetical protein